MQSVKLRSLDAQKWVIIDMKIWNVFCLIASIMDGN
jgi:hypothetical protein